MSVLDYIRWFKRSIAGPSDDQTFFSLIEHRTADQSGDIYMSATPTNTADPPVGAIKRSSFQKWEEILLCSTQTALHN